jgi:hypothetical protein
MRSAITGVAVEIWAVADRDDFEHAAAEPATFRAVNTSR